MAESKRFGIINGDIAVFEETRKPDPLTGEGDQVIVQRIKVNGLNGSTETASAVREVLAAVNQSLESTRG